jgi:hypothetical protein
MSRNEALFEICELASSLIHQVYKDTDEIPALFAMCEEIKDQCVEEGIGHEDFSEEYQRCAEWLKGAGSFLG